MNGPESRRGHLGSTLVLSARRPIGPHLFHLEGTVLISGDPVVPVAVAVQRGEHDAERAGPLAEEDEEVVAKTLLGEQESPVVH